MEPHEYLLKHSQALSEEYPGKYIAVVRDRVVAASRSALVAFKEAKKEFPEGEIAIFYMPTDEEKVTKFKSDEEEADFWDRFDTTQILEEGEELWSNLYRVDTK